MPWNDNLEAGTAAHSFASSNAQVIRTVAGPGSGKSFAIGRRVARLIEVDNVDPTRILAITFTRTAAKDLKDDISGLGVDGCERVAARTVHSHALSILMRANVIESTGRTPRMILEHEIAPALRDLDDPEFGDVRAKKNLLEFYLAAWADLQSDEPGFAHDPIQQQFEDELVEWMKRHKGMLVGEVIPVVIEYLRFNPESTAIGNFDVILVDEYQDLNRAEQEFIHLIKGNANVVIVGDDDQSIYGFKHAHPEGIREVEQLHGVYDDILFAECRRCPTAVTELASQLISNNTNRTLGDLTPFASNPDGNVTIAQWTDSAAEVAGISSLIEQELEGTDIEPKDVLVLTPRRRIGYQIRDILSDRNIPARSYFRESAIEKKTAQRAYSLLCLTHDVNNLIAWRYLLGYGSNDFRKRQYALLESGCEEGETILDVLHVIDNGERRVPRTSQILTAYRSILEEIATLRELFNNNPQELFDSHFITDDETLDEIGELADLFDYSLEVVGEYDPEDQSLEEWFAEVMTIFQQEVSNPAIPEEIDHVRIMSLHSSKGLSSPMVVVCGAIDELIPGKSDEGESLEEQRRLFYVAITRCKCTDDYDGKLILSSFVRIPGRDALNMGIPASANAARQTRATRFFSELGNQAPRPVRGRDLIN